MTVLLVFLYILLALLFAELLSLLIWGRSAEATAVALFLRLVVHQPSDEKVLRELPSLPEVNDVPYRLPGSAHIRSAVTRYTCSGTELFLLGDGRSEGVVLCLPGGGYVRQPRSFHFRFYDRICRESGLACLVMIYPKAPAHTVTDTYAALSAVYDGLLREGKRVYMLGDSSGGGLALGFCQWLRREGKRQPEHLFLMSPWVDITLSNPRIQRYEKKDPMIAAAPERIWGRAYAGDVDPTDSRVSPIYGDLSALAPVTLFAGTREILWPDNELLYEGFRECGTPVRMVIGQGLGHVYPVYPLVPEAADARRRIVEELVSMEAETKEADAKSEKDTACAFG